MTENLESLATCWCGEPLNQVYGGNYWKCSNCGTLCSQSALKEEDIAVTNDDDGFYGRHYWFEHQTCDLGHPDIIERARADLSERCIYWLKSLLKYRLPPGRILEIGCAHGGSTALMKWSGFDAIGLELSPWVVDFATRSFDVPILLGTIEQQGLENASLDAVAMFDVLEHLVSPVTTMNICAKLLKPDGIFLVQMPDVPENRSYNDMVDDKDPFLVQLKHEQHLQLFTTTAARKFFKDLGFTHLKFLQPLFSYDMFFAASRVPMVENSEESISGCLSATPSGRLVQALLDLDDKLVARSELMRECEDDRAARLEVIESLSEKLDWAEQDRAARLKVIESLSEKLDSSEQDRAARLEVIESLSEKLDSSEQDRSARLEVVESLSEKLDSSEQDRAARLKVIESLSEKLDSSEQDRAARLEVIESLSEKLDSSEQDRAARLKVIESLSERLDSSEQDRAARLKVIESLSEKLSTSEGEIQRLRGELDRIPIRWYVHLRKMAARLLR